MKFSFFTYCDDEFQERFGTHKIINSLKYFHPNHNVILYGSKEIKKVHEKYNVNIGNALPCMMLEAKREYGLDYIIHTDSDSLCFGYLESILDFNYEVASVLNNPEIGQRDERMNRPQCLWNLENSKYVSCGLISCGSERFLLEWHELNQEIVKTYGGIKAFWQCDQNFMNYAFHYRGFKSKILDPLDGKVFYGPSANMYSKNNHNPDCMIKEYGTNTCQSWFDIEYKDDKFWLYEKEIKILHQSCGGNKNTVWKCHFSLFNDKVKEKLQEITGFKE